MINKTPYYPKPTKSKASLILTFFSKNRSWLNNLYERSYSMKMGRVKMPGLDLHVVNEPTLVRRILVDEVDKFPKNKLLAELLEPLLGDGIFTSSGNIWRKQRDMLDPSFVNARISKVFSLMNDAASDLLEDLDRYEDGSTIEVDAEMTYVTADIIFRTILSQKLSREDSKKIILAFTTFQEETAKAAMRTMFRVPAFMSYFMGERKRTKAGNEIRDVLAGIIQPRYDAVTNKEELKDEDILSTLLQVVDPDTKERFSFKEILDQVAMLFLAGHETTASSLTWTLYLLSKYEQEQEKAYQEVISVSSIDDFKAIDIKRMKYLTNIFKESLRLYPPIGFIVRESMEETVMRKKKINKHAAVVVAPWLMHRHSDYWENPHEYNPERFSKPENIIKDSFIPFGLGERVCIGSGFAMQESILILASILRKYKLTLEDGFVPDVVGRLTVRSANGMNVVFTKREE